MPLKDSFPQPSGRGLFTSRLSRKFFFCKFPYSQAQDYLFPQQTAPPAAPLHSIGPPPKVGRLATPSSSLGAASYQQTRCYHSNTEPSQQYAPPQLSVHSTYRPCLVIMSTWHFDLHRQTHRPQWDGGCCAHLQRQHITPLWVRSDLPVGPVGGGLQTCIPNEMIPYSNLPLPERTPSERNPVFNR